MIQTAQLIIGHRSLFAAVVPILLLVSLVLQPSLIWQIIALGSFVVLLGLPHGALDHRVATSLWSLSTLRGHTLFFAGYIGLAVAVLTVWIIASNIALAAFLIYSAVHFSDDWRDDLGMWQSFPLGISVIALPSLVFQSDVAELFGFLTSTQVATLFAKIMHDIAIVAIAVSAFCLVLNFRTALWVTLEYSLLVAAALVTPPLIYFVIYFCGLHSPRHFVQTVAQLRLTPMQGLRASLPILTATLVLTTFGAVTLTSFNSTLQTTVLQIVFPGLAALTVPHMLLTAAFRSVRKEALARPCPGET